MAKTEEQWREQKNQGLQSLSSELSHFHFHCIALSQAHKSTDLREKLQSHLPKGLDSEMELGPFWQIIYNRNI